MTTTPQDALIKIRRQLKIAREYRKDNPEWYGARLIVEILERRETELTKGMRHEPENEAA
jgi:hypothetical protein